jgi:large subunit ribosomal protein L10
MPKTKKEKQEVVQKLKEELEDKRVVLFIDFRGLKTKEMFNLKNQLKKIASKLLVVKKTLLALALKDKKIDFEKEKFQGQIAIVLGLDEISLSKTLYQFSQNFENLRILGGYLKNGQYDFLEREEVLKLAKLPTKEEILTKLLRTLKNPISSLINIFDNNIKGLVFALNSIKELKSK